MNFAHRQNPDCFAFSLRFVLRFCATARSVTRSSAQLQMSAWRTRPPQRKIYALLDGITLEKAAVIADEIKAWDKNGVDDPRRSITRIIRNIDRQLRDFWRANPPTPRSEFARAVAPLVSLHRRSGGSAASISRRQHRSQPVGHRAHDSVSASMFCRGECRNKTSGKSRRPSRLILLAHYVADIHQPLHVGAEYFDQQGRLTDPDKDKSALADEGGNTFTLELSDEPPRRRGIRKKKFHGFWDYDAVNALFPAGAERAAEKGTCSAD